MERREVGRRKAMEAKNKGKVRRDERIGVRNEKRKEETRRKEKFKDDNFGLRAGMFINAGRVEGISVRQMNIKECSANEH